MISLYTVNAMPDGERLHALFLGYREGSCGFEVTGLGTVIVPETNLQHAGDLEAMTKGEDLNVKRDGSTVVVWRANP